MSNTLAIGAVTTTLRNMLLRAQNPIDGVDPTRDLKLNDIEVTTRPPAVARERITKTQLNIFLYDIRPNAALRNQDLRPRTHPGESAMTPLALDLYYLVTAWGDGDNDELAHRALGWAMAQLHDQAILLSSTIQAAIATNDLHRQSERVRLTPVHLSLEDMSKVWTMSQGSYRASAAFQASTVLIDSSRRATAQLPVLGWQVGAQADPSAPPPALPTLTAWNVPTGAPAAQLGDSVAFAGAHLDGPSVTAYFVHPMSAAPLPLTAAGGGTSALATFTLPTGPTAVNNWPAGPWSVAVGPTGDPGATTNVLALAVAPTLKTVAPPTATVDADGDVTLTVTMEPAVWPEQKVFLLVGSRMVPAPARTTKVTQIVFAVRGAPLGTQSVRLRVDGVDSVLIDYAQMKFDPAQQVVIKK